MSVLVFSDEETQITGKDNTGIKSTKIKHSSERNLEKIARKIKGDAKWRWKGKSRISAKERRELNQKRHLMRYFHGAKTKKVSQLSSSRLRAYGVDRKKKKTD